MENDSSTFNFELVSPEAKLLSEPAWQVTVPGEDGTFGVRAGHCSLVASVRSGVVEVIAKEGDSPRRIFIAGGFADVTGTQCTVLAEEAVNVGDLDRDAAEQEVRNLSEDLSLATDDVSRVRVQAKLDIARARLKAVGG